MSGATLKLIAIFAMTVDHIGVVFFPGQLWLRLLGRLAFPIFAFSAAQGARYTHSRKHYLLRLLFWAVLSEIPYDLMSTGQLFSMEGANVLWTLATGAVCCWLLESTLAKSARYTGVALLCILCTLLMTDYMFPGVLAVVIFYHYIGKKELTHGSVWATFTLFLCLGPPQLAGMAAALPLSFYNGKPGPRLKYLFYLYYPAHMLVLWVGYQLMLVGV